MKFLYSRNRQKQVSNECLSAQMLPLMKTSNYKRNEGKRPKTPQIMTIQVNRSELQGPEVA